jgi:hypothetical protein
LSAVTDATITPATASAVNWRTRAAQICLKFYLKNADAKFMTDQEKAYFSLNKYFLSLQHKLTEYEMSRQNPPSYLVKHFEAAKRRLRIFSKALNQ